MWALHCCGYLIKPKWRKRYCVQTANMGFTLSNICPVCTCNVLKKSSQDCWSAHCSWPLLYLCVAGELLFLCSTISDMSKRAAEGGSSITWYTDAAWKSRKNLPLVRDQVSFSTQFICLHTAPLTQNKTLIEDSGKHQQKEANPSNLYISHLIRKMNIAVKWNWPSAESLGGIKALINSKPQ